MQRTPYSFSTLFCEFVLFLPHPLFTCDHHFFSSSHTISALLNSQKLFFNNSLFFFFRLFPPQLNSFHLFPALLNDSHLCPPLLNSSHLLPTSSHPRSTHLNPSHLLSTLLSSCQLFSTLLTSFHRDALHREICTHRSFYTQIFFHRQVVSQIFFYTANSYTEKLLHTANFYTQQTFTHSKLLHRETATQDAPKWKNLLPKHRSQPSCSYYNTVYDSQLQNKIVFHMQLQQRGTMPQPFHCDLQTLSCKEIFAPRLRKWQLQTVSRRPNGKNTILKHFLKGFILSTEYHHRQNGETSA